MPEIPSDQLDIDLTAGYDGLSQIEQRGDPPYWYNTGRDIHYPELPNQSFGPYTWAEALSNIAFTSDFAKFEGRDPQDPIQRHYVTDNTGRVVFDLNAPEDITALASCDHGEPTYTRVKAIITSRYLATP